MEAQYIGTRRDVPSPASGWPGAAEYEDQRERLPVDSGTGEQRAGERRGVAIHYSWAWLSLQPSSSCWA